jgi:hypothetical protein
MRQLLSLAALMAFLMVGHSAESVALRTNSITVGTNGVLLLTTPDNWEVMRTNVNPKNPYTVEVHAPADGPRIRLNICWDGFPRVAQNPTASDLDKIVSNVVARQYLPICVEKTVELEKLKGPHVTGTFVRLTDAHWTPVVKSEYQNQGVGMFRTGSLWGDFDLLCNDKDGPQFQAGLKVLETLRKKP